MSSKTVFVIDIETTSADKSIAEVLEIGILALNFTKSGIFLPAEGGSGQITFHMYLHTDKDPATNFAREYQAHLFERCHNATKLDPADIRQAIKLFFKDHGVATKPAKMLGLNAASFDLPLMVKHRLLKEALWVDSEDSQELVGDFHYRVEDITGIRLAAARIFNMGFQELTTAAVALCPEIALPEGKAHDAIYDCYKQTKMYNGFLRLLRGGRMR